MKASRFNLINTQKGRLQSLPFLAMKEVALGKKYSLSVAFVSAGEIKKLNKKFRGFNEATDILSFPLSEDAGEIIICAAQARRKAPLFGRPFRNFLQFIFIHGLVHLKGYRHGSTMEREEEKIRKEFGI